MSSGARWLDELALAAGEDELRRVLRVAIDRGELGDFELERQVLRKIVDGAPRAKPRRRRAA